MADKIATRADCNNIVSGAFSSETNKCPTYSEISGTNKFKISGSYSNNQLVCQKDISKSSSVTASGTPIIYPMINKSLSSPQFAIYDGSAVSKILFPIMCFEDGYDAVESGSQGNAIVTPYYKSEVINSVLTAKFIQTPSSLITRSVSVLNSYPPSGVSSGTSQGNIDFNDSFLENSRFPRSNKMLVYIFDINNFTINTSTIFACMELKNPSDTNIVTTETANRYKKYSIRTRTATASDDNQIFVGGCNEGSTGTERGVNIRYLAEDSLPTSSSGSKTFAYGSVFRLSSIPTTNSFMVSYPAEASVVGGDSWPGYIYENIGNRVRTGIYLVDFANLTGTISCKLTINVATSVFGSTARIGAECEINGNEIVTIIPGTNYEDLSTMPKVNTNQDYTYTYNISMNSSTYLDNQAIWIFVSNESGTVTLDHYIEIGEIDYYSQVGDLNIVPSSISKRQYDKLQLRNLYIKITGENSYTVEARQ